MKKMLGIREKIFAFLTLFIISVLSIARFIIAFVRECELIKDLSGREYVEDVLNFSAINYVKVIMISIVCIALLLIISSYIYLFVKNTNIKRCILIVGFALLLAGIIFFYISRFMCEDYYSIDIFFTANEERELLCEFGEEYHRHAIYLIFSLITAIIMHFTAFSLSNEYYKEQEDVNDMQIENSANDTTEEEKVLSEEINKLKAKIKIKDLEKEYLQLKSKLDE